LSLSLDRVGFREDDLETFRRLINKPNGIVVVTGPTGSGKTTTLYAALASSTTSRRRS
jgi:type II secretory ATPase GspE/PulE/Tfp pilus assembly ATPase PilB-like protein